jgi:hypothetical protein
MRGESTTKEGFTVPTRVSKRRVTTQKSFSLRQVHKRVRDE